MTKTYTITEQELARLIHLATTGIFLEVDDQEDELTDSDADMILKYRKELKMEGHNEVK